MTPNEARRRLTSLLFRRRLNLELPEIEAELISFVKREGEQILNGYRLWVERDELKMEKIEVVSSNQLKLPLYPEWARS